MKGTILGMNGFGWAEAVFGVPFDKKRFAEHAMKLGFDGIELFGMPDPYPRELNKQNEIRRFYEDHGLKIPAIQSVILECVGSRIDFIRRNYVDTLKWQIEFATVLGAEIVGVWAGESLGPILHPDVVGRLIDTYRQCAAFAEQHNVTLTLEGEPVQLPSRLDILMAILDGVGHPCFKTIFDFSHANILTHGAPMRWYGALKDKVGHTHICDNDGTCTERDSMSSRHLPLGEGTMNYKAILKALLNDGYDGWWDVDCWEYPDPYKCAEVSKRQLDRAFSELGVS